MNVLFYSPVDLRNGLGCERWHCDVTNSLKDQFGDDVEIVTGNLGTPRWADEYLEAQLRGVKYTRFDFPIILSSIIPDPISFWRLWKKIKNVSCVHFITGFIGQDIMMAVLKLITGKRFVVGFHAPLFFSSNLHNWYVTNVSRRILPLFDSFMTLNKSDCNTLTGWGLKNVHFIPSGVRTENFLKIPRKKHSKLNFLSVGRYDTKQKGFDLLAEAITEFNRKYSDNKARFHFAGSAASPTAVEELSSAQKNVVNHGYVSYEKMPSLYEEADVFLLSSREEPFGLILVEAWSSGMPILATKTEGPRDMLIEGKNGWFIDTISKSSITRGIERAYGLWKSSPNVFLSMEQFCRNTGKKYSIDTTAANMRKLLSS